MTECLIVCRSLTYAQRASRAIERTGLRASLVRIKPELTDKGCGYAIKVIEKNLGQSLEIMEKNSIQAGKIFSIGEDGSYRERTP